MEDQIIITNAQYNSGFCLEEYNDRYSLVDAFQAKDGAVVKKWGYRQKDKRPMEKASPWRIELGTREEAISRLHQLLGLLGAEVPGPERLPDGDFDPSNPDDIPF